MTTFAPPHLHGANGQGIIFAERMETPVRHVRFIIFLHVLGWGLLIYASTQHFNLVQARCSGSGRASSRTPWACVTLLTLTTSPPLTTRRENSCPRASGRCRPVSSSRSGILRSSLPSPSSWDLAYVPWGPSAKFELGLTPLRRPHRHHGVGGFLYLIAILNLIILVGIVRLFVQMRQGTFNDAELEKHLDARGFMMRFFGRFARSVDAPWKMYPVGLLFGLGFDTATEVLSSCSPVRAWPPDCRSGPS